MMEKEVSVLVDGQGKGRVPCCERRGGEESWYSVGHQPAGGGKGMEGHKA
jgi:hypothetical protein